MIDNLSRVHPISAKLFLDKSFKIHCFFALPLASLPEKLRVKLLIFPQLKSLFASRE
jgi:hypothetical protein